MPRTVERTRNGGTWTEARYNSFIKSLLRRGTLKWGPIHEVKRKARVSRGVYQCAGCQDQVPVSVIKDRKRVNNVHVDHIEPVVDPAEGFLSWDEVIRRMFVEEEDLQLLCGDCHTVKTNKEKQIATERRDRERTST